MLSLILSAISFLFSSSNAKYILKATWSSTINHSLKKHISQNHNFIFSRSSFLHGYTSNRIGWILAQSQKLLSIFIVTFHFLFLLETKLEYIYYITPNLYATVICVSPEQYVQYEQLYGHGTMIAACSNEHIEGRDVKILCKP